MLQRADVDLITILVWMRVGTGRFCEENAGTMAGCL